MWDARGMEETSKKGFSPSEDALMHDLGWAFPNQLWDPLQPLPYHTDYLLGFQLTLIARGWLQELPVEGVQLLLVHGKYPLWRGAEMVPKSSGFRLHFCTPPNESRSPQEAALSSQLPETRGSPLGKWQHLTTFHVGFLMTFWVAQQRRFQIGIPWSWGIW